LLKGIVGETVPSVKGLDFSGCDSTALQSAPDSCSAGPAIKCFYEKVINVKADVAALLIFDLRHISAEKFALGSLRSDDWQLGRPTVSPLLSVFR
jgi:hypothetical protein